MTLKEFDTKRAELKAKGKELAMAGKLEEAEAVKTEIEKLESDFQAEKDMVAEQNALNKRPVPVGIRDETELGDETNMKNKFNAASPEYRNAFLKSISGRADAMTELENTAYTQTTTTGAAVLPTTMLNEIWDCISGNHAIIGDINTYRTGTILEVVKCTTIVAGKAKKVAEGAANDDEQNTFVKVTLAGNDFSKTVKLSYAAAQMSIDALESYLITEISNELGRALADDVIASIESGINTANQATSATVGTIKYTELLAAFGALKRVTTPVVYCTRATLYNQLAALTDGGNNLIYQPSMTVGVPGTLLGAEVKIEDSVADGVVLVGDPNRVTCNMVQDIMVETDKDITNHVYIYSGYCRGEAALIDDLSFAMVTVKTA